MAEYTFVVDKNGLRLDSYVAEVCPGLSRTQAQKLIANGCVTVNDQRAKAGLRLDIGDSVHVTVPPPPPNPLSPEAIPLDIIYEDEDILVLNKPAGMTVQDRKSVV